MKNYVTVSGATFYTALDPDCSSLLAEIGIEHYEIRPRGKGAQVLLRCNRQQAVELLAALEDVRDLRCGPGCDGDPSERAALRKDCERVREQIAS